VAERLSDKQLKELRKLILKRIEDTETVLGRGKSSSEAVELSSPIGRLSRMDAMQQQQMALENKRRAELTLARLKSALRRIESGDYGACLECGESISQKRLQSQPEATLCIECQSERELR